MKRTFIQFITESDVFNGVPSFYNIYTTPFPSYKTIKMKDGKKKDEAKAEEQTAYNKLLADFLQHAGVMNK